MMFNFLSRKRKKKENSLSACSAINESGSDQFTLKDFGNQLDKINKIGSLQKVSRFIPGMPSISSEMIERGKREIKKFKAIISCMSLDEQLNPQILNNSKKLRIAKESGTQVSDIDLLIQRFEETKQFAKMFRRTNKK